MKFGEGTAIPAIWATPLRFIRIVFSTGTSSIDTIGMYGAYTAANLDGGSSSIMVYNNEIVNKCASLYGSRRMPTAFIVKSLKVEENVWRSI